MQSVVEVINTSEIKVLLLERDSGNKSNLQKKIKSGYLNKIHEKQK